MVEQSGEKEGGSREIVRMITLVDKFASSHFKVAPWILLRISEVDSIDLPS